MKKSLLITAAILMVTAGYASADNAKPTTFAEMDVNGDMVLTKEEVQGRLLQNFDKLDIDDNGTLSQDEMPMGKKGKAGGHHKGPNFADLDKNGDKVLSKDEAQGRLLDNFAQLDKDGSGTLSQDEMPMGKQGKSGRQHKRPTFVQLDANKDGSLSEAEYNVQPQSNKDKGHQRHNFQQMDKNNNGVLDKTEVRGRLLANFEKLDADNSDTLSLEELPSQQK